MSSEELEFRDYRASDQATILSLLAHGRPAGYLNEKRAVFEWQFFGNPRACGRSPFIVGTFQGQIVAVNGLMPVRVRVGHQVLDACWSLDTYVSDAHRGKGFGKALIGRVTTSAPIVLGFGISDMSDPIFARNEWVLDEAMATYLFHAREVGWKGWLKNLGCALRQLGARAGGQAQGIMLAKAAELPRAEIDALWRRVAAHYPNAVERDGTYMHWRYGQAPRLRYHWITARDEAGVLQAALVLRQHPVEAVIVDYVGPLDSPGLLAQMVVAARADLVSGGARRIRCEANHPGIKHALQRAGFRLYRHPGRFRLRSNIAGLSAHDIRWFVMTGDSDNDLLAN